MLEKDRKFIENKYHMTNEPFNPYNRMAYHGYDYDVSTGMDDDEIKAGLKNLYEKIKDLPHPVAKAYAVKYTLDNTRIDVNEHDYFVGFYSVNRLASAIGQWKWYGEVFDKIIPKTKALIDDMNNSGAVTVWPDFDHVVPDWNSLLTLGFSGIIERVKSYRQKHAEGGTLTDEAAAYFDGMEITYCAVIDVIDRLYKYALTQNHGKAKRIADCLKHIRDGAPTNIYEAMQLTYIYFMVSECFDGYQVRSLGNGLDGSLYPFYENDLKNGTFTRDEIKELIGYFLMQWSAIGNFWGQPFYMGGTDTNGGTKYNDLSADILDVYDRLGIYNPKIQIKVNENTPDKILFKVFDMIRRGHSSFVFCCEPGMVRAVMSYGASYEEALNMDIRGCYETGVRADEVSTAAGYVNALKPIEYVFSNGFDKRLGRQFGLKTGEPGELKTFDIFYNAVLRQWENLIEMAVGVSDSYEKYLGTINPSNMYSATVERSLERGRDAYQSGVKFNNSAILNCGFASLVDSVMTVKEFVYDKKEVSLAELKNALDNNWKGYEPLHTKIRKSCHKYGNSDTTADVYSQAMAAYFAMKVNNRPNARGGVYKAIMHSAMQFIEQGKLTSATPDGRYDGDEISKNASPSVGMDKNGVTALINSALCVKPYIYPESFCLDIMLHPTAVEGDGGLGIMKALLFAYMNGGGMSIQFNVFSIDTLKDAQKNPQKYQNLQVRVCGWNVLWNNLSEKEQNSYIARAENIG